MSTLRLYSLAVSAALAGGLGLYYWLRSQNKTPEQRERDRREWLAAIGRINDGTIMDACEGGYSEQEGITSPAQLLIFHYDVAGVTYEASQDVTYLRHFIDLHTCRLGVPASVKYDPQNPGNSIVISESWSGLRKWPLQTTGIAQQAAQAAGAVVQPVIAPESGS